MENLEQYWEQSFSPIGRKFTEIRPDYQDMGCIFRRIPVQHFR